MTVEDDEAYVKREEARQMIVDHLFQFANDHRECHWEGDAFHRESERPLALAIDLIHDELAAWARQSHDQ
jgi:hypothetical protein